MDKENLQHNNDQQMYKNNFLNKVAKFFNFKEKDTNFRNEIVGGVVTFLAMSYILAVNPGFMEAAGMDWGGAFLATALIAGLASVVMGLWAKLPLALAPGMGTNVFFAFVVVGPSGMGYTWQEGLAAGLIAGVLFLIISLTGIRKLIMEAVPANLRLAIGAGIGFFIAFIGLQNAGIIVGDAGTLVTLTSFKEAYVVLSLFGIILAFVLHALDFRFSIIISILATTLVAFVLGTIFPKLGLPTFRGIDGFSYKGLAGIKTTSRGFIDGFASKNLWKPELILVVISFTFVDMFDTMGTFMACAGPAGLIKEDGSIEGADRGLIVDSGATIIGNMLGTPVITTYVESSAGIAAGARSGFATVVTGSLFFLSILLFPVIELLFGNTYLTSMALVLVGVLMAQQLKNIEWDKTEVALFSFITIATTVLTYSIANGIAFGFVFYTILMMAQRRFKEVHPIMYAMSAVFVLYYISQAVF